MYYFTFILLLHCSTVKLAMKRSKIPHKNRARGKNAIWKNNKKKQKLFISYIAETLEDKRCLKFWHKM